MIKCVTLISEGRHPSSGWPRCSPVDRRAIELCLGITGAERIFLHAGNPDSSIIADYLGMGIGTLNVLKITDRFDILPPITAMLSDWQPDLIFLGERSDGREETGMVPYLIGRALNIPVMPAVEKVVEKDGEIIGFLVLEAGRRRRLHVTPPAVVVVSGKAPQPRGLSYRERLSGEIITHRVTPDKLFEYRQAPMKTAKSRPKRLETAASASVSDRLQHVMATAGEKQNTVLKLEADEAARRIFDYLRENGCPGF